MSTILLYTRLHTFLITCCFICLYSRRYTCRHKRWGRSGDHGRQSYEQDTFRKPAGEAWQSEYAKLEAALSAVKDEARALREASEGQVSAPEARRLRAQLAKAEAALEIAARERCTDGCVVRKVGFWRKARVWVHKSPQVVYKTFCVEFVLSDATA